MPKMPMQRTVRIEVGMFRSWEVAMLLVLFSSGSMEEDGLLG